MNALYLPILEILGIAKSTYYQLHQMLKIEFIITKDHSTPIASEMILMY
jgi:hypothetical protein